MATPLFTFGNYGRINIDLLSFICFICCRSIFPFFKVSNVFLMKIHAMLIFDTRHFSSSVSILFLIMIFSIFICFGLSVVNIKHRLYFFRSSHKNFSL